MQPFVPRPAKGPEGQILADIENMLRVRGWYVRKMHGNAFQDGFPDLYATHSEYRARWIEVKNPLAYAFTEAQLREFPKFCANGAGVWVLVAATETEYMKLFRPCNWYLYLNVMQAPIRRERKKK